jgi:hypothetical protein
MVEGQDEQLAVVAEAHESLVVSSVCAPQDFRVDAGQFRAGRPSGGDGKVHRALTRL